LTPDDVAEERAIRRPPQPRPTADRSPRQACFEHVPDDQSARAGGGQRAPLTSGGGGAAAAGSVLVNTVVGAWLIVSAFALPTA